VAVFERVDPEVALNQVDQLFVRHVVELILRQFFGWRIADGIRSRRELYLMS
jgi:hypothetical protein